MSKQWKYQGNFLNQSFRNTLTLRTGVYMEANETDYSWEYFCAFFLFLVGTPKIPTGRKVHCH